MQLPEGWEGGSALNSPGLSAGLPLDDPWDAVAKAHAPGLSGDEVRFAVTADGPGSPALDRREWGLGWALAQLAAGVGGAYAVVKFAESNAPAAAQEGAPEPQPAAA